MNKARNNKRKKREVNWHIHSGGTAVRTVRSGRLTAAGF